MYLLQHSAPTAAADDRRRARGKARAARAASLASCRGATWRHRHAPIAAQRRGEPLNHDTPPRPAAPRRRDLLALAAGAAAAAAPQPARAEAPPGTPVVPALTLPQYVAQIQIAAPQAWDEIESNLDAGRYRQQSLQLVLPPFDTVRQAAFFVPWVLLRADDERRATASQEAYLRLRDSIVAFDERLIAAAGRVPSAYEDDSEERVWAAYAAVRAAVDDFMATIGAAPLPR